MTELRQLDDKERAVTEKALERIENDKNVDGKYYEYLIRHANLLLECGLEQNYLKQRREYEMVLKEAEFKLNKIDEKVKVLKTHLTEGVEVKEVKEKEQ